MKELVDPPSDKKSLIEELISFGFYKKDNIHLFELSLADLEEEYKKLQTRRKNE